MQSANSTNIPEGKKQGMHKYLALASIGFFTVAALLVIIFFFNSSLVSLSFVSAFIVLGIAFLGSSFNVARFHNQSVAVRVLAKVSLVANIITAIMIVLFIADVPNLSYSNCDYNCSEPMCSQEQDCYYTCFQEYECIKSDDELLEILIKITGIAIIFSLAGEIIGRYLTYKTTKKIINITRWVAIVLTTLLSLLVIIYLLFVTLDPLMTQITFCIFALCLLAVISTPILLLVEKRHNK